MLECEERGLMLHEAKVGSEEECSAGNGNNKTSFLVLNVMSIQMFSKTLITEWLKFLTQPMESSNFPSPSPR